MLRKEKLAITNGITLEMNTEKCSKTIFNKYLFYCQNMYMLSRH